MPIESGILCLVPESLFVTYGTSTYVRWPMGLYRYLVPVSLSNNEY